MDEDVITDLKQFISSTVSQHTTEIEVRVKRLDEQVNAKIDALDHKVDALSGVVSDALDASNEITGARLTNHDRRIVRLEHKIA
jgi:uncharacterized protein YoxC